VDMWTIGVAAFALPRFPSELGRPGSAHLRPHTRVTKPIDIDASKKQRSCTSNLATAPTMIGADIETAGTTR
jgi:hypothetical protein